MPAGDNSFPYDVTFTVSGTTYGFMLVTPKGETKQINFSESQQPEAQRLVTESIATSYDFDPRVDTPFSMKDFTGGCGQLEWDFNDDTSYLWSSGVITHVPGRVYMSPPASSKQLSGATGDVTGMCTYLTSANARYDFLWETVNIWRRDASNITNGWTKVYTAGVDITDFKIFNGTGIICTPSDGTTTDFLTQADVTAAALWVPTGRNHTPFAVGTKPIRMKGIRGTCYAFVGNDLVYYTTDPTIDGWTGPIDTALTGTGNLGGSTGDSTYPIQGINVVNDFLFVRKKDAIYSIDSQQDVIEVIWQWKDKPSEYNFKFAAVGGDQLIYNVKSELFIYDPQTGVNTNTGFSRKSGFTIKNILGIASDSQYIYVLAQVRVAVVRTADSIAVFRGIKVRPGAIAWEVLWEDNTIGTDTFGPLWAFPSAAGTRLYWMRNDSDNTDTIMMDIPAEFDESYGSSFDPNSVLWTSVSRSGFPGFQKRHLYFNMNLANSDASNYITPSLLTENGTTALASSSSNSYEANFSDKYSLWCYLKFQFNSAGTTTPILKTFDHHQRVRFKFLPRVQLSIRVADGIELRNGTKSTLKAYQLWDNLKTLRESNNEITYKDFLGNSFPCTFDVFTSKPSRHQAKMEYEEEAVVVITRADRGS